MEGKWYIYLKIYMREVVILEKYQFVVSKEFIFDDWKVKNVNLITDYLFIAGPCSIENYNQMEQLAFKLKQVGANIIRGGAFKPRTSPYSFQGLGTEGLRILKEIGEMSGLPTVTEVLDVRDIDVASACSDILQVGTRNMMNYSLLKELGRCSKPIVLKRGMCSKIEEWLWSAEYIMSEGNRRVLLCERGIRTFENWTRNTLDLSAVSILKNMTNLPVIVDPSHGTGRSDIVESMSLAAVFSNCNGVIVEVHEKPDLSITDAKQAISVEQFGLICKKTKEILKIKKQWKN